MRNFKESVYELCAEIAAGFSGWRFVSGKFKNDMLKHTELAVDLGLYFDRGFTDLDPIIEIRNKRFDALWSMVFDVKKSNSPPVSSVAFKVLDNSMRSEYSLISLSGIICADKGSYLATIAADSRMAKNDRKVLSDNALDINEVRPVIAAIMEDAISFVNGQYDLSSEADFLRGLPVQYGTRNKIPYDELERQKGVVLCVVRAMTGDFEFVENYIGDEFQTIFPKRMNELKRLIDALPDFKARYGEAGLFG